MKAWSLQTRLGVAVGALVATLWAGGAAFTANRLSTRIDAVFDGELESTAERILPLAVSEVLGREEVVTGAQVMPLIRDKDGDEDEPMIYIVRNAAGEVLMLSHGAKAEDFPPYDGPGFRTARKLRLYADEALRGSVTIAVAEPTAHRRAIRRELMMGLFAPLIVLLPLTLVGIGALMRLGFAPMRRFRDRLAKRSAADLAPVELDGLPAEARPLAETINALLSRLDAAFEAERSFAANAAHELRTPLAGAIAQVQRLRAETEKESVATRARDIEAVLKRLTRLSEGLMSLARAEGGKLRGDAVQDLRPVAQLVVEDTARLAGSAQVTLDLPEGPVLSDLDPDLFAILLRNLVANALRHGTAGAPVTVQLSETGSLSVQNDCDPLPPEDLARIGARFERAAQSAGRVDGAGLGLAIVQAILSRAGGALALFSPIPGQSRGFEARANFRLRAEI
ncbi:two-component system OmpR family sensor kinase [Rhodobacter sp. JA431]|uniref:ATP-binding protein n=1 Tax=Rhodobacter sp. JA431 TaxID=570013 RepID=UPI000BCCA54F|nr:ATP-binding protein [Rhodobacter sp. JA431]SOC14422.1 two-component system OmpR family sensor kinase [Rhodobacter sp. JA431]